MYASVWNTIKNHMTFVFKDYTQLTFCLKKSSSNHFADDTCLIHGSKRIKTLETDLNTDLKVTSEWLNCNSLPIMTVLATDF